MDDEARRIYDELNHHLTAERPDDLPTADDIGFYAVNYWGSHLTDMRHEREGAVNYAKSVADGDKREQAVADANRFFDEKEQDFERHFNAAVKEIRRENGFSFEDNFLDDREPNNQQTVEVRSSAQEAANRNTDRNINQGGERVFGEAQFANRASELPERRNGEKQRDGEQGGREKPDALTLDNKPTPQARAELGIANDAPAGASHPCFRKPPMSFEAYCAQKEQARTQGPEQTNEQQNDQKRGHGPELSLS